MINYKDIEMNLTDDNNFFVSNSFVEKVKYNMKAEPHLVTNDEIQILKRVEVRRNMCTDKDIHYFILPDPSTSLGAVCHYCGLTVADYSRMERVQKQ
jgi:hypothetical protein